MSDLMEPTIDFIDCSHALSDGFALEDPERNDYALNKSGKVSIRLAGRSDVLNCVFNTGGVSTTTCKKKDDNFENDEILLFH